MANVGEFVELPALVSPVEGSLGSQWHRAIHTRASTSICRAQSALTAPPSLTLQGYNAMQSKGSKAACGAVFGVFVSSGTSRATTITLAMPYASLGMSPGRLFRSDMMPRIAGF